MLQYWKNVLQYCREYAAVLEEMCRCIGECTAVLEEMCCSIGECASVLEGMYCSIYRSIEGNVLQYCRECAACSIGECTAVLEEMCMCRSIGENVLAVFKECAAVLEGMCRSNRNQQYWRECAAGLHACMGNMLQNWREYGSGITIAT